MRVGVMITNGGTHPPEKWAEQTVAQIIQVSKEALGDAAIAARRLELRMLDVLETAHAEVQAAEKKLIKDLGLALLEQDIDPTPHVQKPLDALVEAAAGTPFEAHFAKPEIRDYLRRVLGQHFGTAMHIERSTYGDGFPGHSIAIAYKQRYSQGIVSPAPPTA